jgi:uncharacterized protein
MEQLTMTNTTTTTTYFEKPGPQNTQQTLQLAKQRANQLNIKNIIIATTTGKTGAQASQLFKNYNLIVVTHVTGFTEPNTQQLLPEHKKTIQNNGAKIITTTHAFGTLGRAINKKFGTIQIDEIISTTLRLFGQGTKVGCEIACMATDAGAITTTEDAIVIGGTMSGADTALVLKPSNTHTAFDLRIREIICKPHL